MHVIGVGKEGGGGGRGGGVEPDPKHHDFVKEVPFVLRARARVRQFYHVKEEILSQNERKLWIRSRISRGERAAGEDMAHPLTL
jgi:hypothetical protein